MAFWGHHGKKVEICFCPLFECTNKRSERQWQEKNRTRKDIMA